MLVCDEEALIKPASGKCGIGVGDAKGDLIAPAAQIVVYFAPNTDAGFLDAITTAIHDSQHQPSVISISWGSPEAAWTPQAMQSFDGAFQAAGSMGVTV